MGTWLACEETHSHAGSIYRRIIILQPTAFL